MKWLALIAALALCPGCAQRNTTVHEDEPTAPPAATEAATETSDREAPPEKTTFVGEAVNAKLGAAVNAPEAVVFCVEMDAWPDDVVGKRVAATGFVERTDQFKAEVAKDGAISQGTAGGDTVLRSVTYEVVQE
jgi:hypothetical protein